MSARTDSPPEPWDVRPVRQELLAELITIVKYHDMNRGTLIERIEEARTVLERL
jgi:hypothetical protein